MSISPIPDPVVLPRRRYVRAIGPQLRRVLWVVFCLAGLLAANTAYLLAVRLMEAIRATTYQNYFYQCMFLAHLVLGVSIVVPFIVFGIGHIRNSHDRPQRRAVRIGYALFIVCLILLFSGLGLMRLEPFVIKGPAARRVLYVAHVATPLLVIWLYVLHRLAGPRIKWKFAGKFAIGTAVVVTAMLIMHSRDPRKWNVVGPREGDQYFRPSMARTTTGNFIPAQSLMNDRYCMECHQDNYKSWFHSAHHFSSFNNPMYLFSVRETRKVSLQRDGNVRAARWCAGCHDTVPFFSGAFDRPDYDDVNDPTAHAGLTCTSCHAITHVNSTRGNADYTIEEPIQYPFAFSQNRALRFINRQLIKAKPEFHKQTFLKPLHKSSEFCSVCHKVSIPGDLNHYKEFLRGQNHYDSFLLSGTSGHGAKSFYYPERAVENCAGCHMPAVASKDFGATTFDLTQPAVLSVHDHLFPAANTALPALRSDEETVKREQDFLTGVTRVDLVGIKEGGSIDSPFTMVRPAIPTLTPGKSYLLEMVVRTLKVGHLFTQGTADSNEVWLDVRATVPDRLTGHVDQLLGQSGGRNAAGEVDPWASFLNIFMLDRRGNRIDRRNVQDIFTPLYDHQIPPGAARVVHYRLTIPPSQKNSVKVSIKLRYRKFDAHFLQLAIGGQSTKIVPVTTMAQDEIVFPVDGAAGESVAPSSIQSSARTLIPPWQRWNDYGIAMLLEGSNLREKGEWVGAVSAFEQVEKLGRSEGPVNLARVYIKQGRFEEAKEALGRAVAMFPPPPSWTVAWLNGLIHRQTGDIDSAIDDLSGIIDRVDAEMKRRGFDFSKDYEVLNELGGALFDRSKRETQSSDAQTRYLLLARDRFEQTLAIDSENITAHYLLWQIYSRVGDPTRAAEHAAEHARLRPDDNATDHAILVARQRSQAVDHASQAVTIYDLSPEPTAYDR